MIENVSLVKLEDPKFVIPKRMIYEEDGIKKSWEVVTAHDSVAVLIYNSDQDAFVLVKQFRPAVYLNNDDGMSYELCAGIIDKEKSKEQITVEEIFEETGYLVSVDRLEKITSFYTSVGFAGSSQDLYFVTVCDADRCACGGGIEFEKIEVVHLPVGEARNFMYDEDIVKTPGLMFAFLWFFDKKERKCL